MRRLTTLLVLALSTAAFAEEVWVRKAPVVKDTNQEALRGKVDFDESHFTYSVPAVPEGPTTWPSPAGSDTIRWTPPPAELRAGDEFKITLTCTQSRGVGIGACCLATDSIALSEPTVWAESLNNNPGGTQVLTFKPKAGSRSATVVVRAGLSGYKGVLVTWTYERQGGEDPGTSGGTTDGGGPGPKTDDCELAATLANDTVEVVPGQGSQTTNVVISGWCHHSGKPVQVIFPNMSDAFGTHPNNLVVPLGQGEIDPSQMGDRRGADGSYGKEYPSEVFVRARSNSGLGTTDVPIIVRQEGCGEVALTMFVRVVQGRKGQSGPPRDGSGVRTGDGGGTPPVTEGTSASGLFASISAESVVVRPGGNSETVNVSISGWRTGTADQVEVRFPQEGEDRGNLGNDIVVFPGCTALDPANMGAPTHVMGFGFRAMAGAPGGTTAVRIIVRQRRASGPGEPVKYDEVRLVLHVVVPAQAPAGGGAGNPGPGNPGGGNPGAGNPGGGTPGAGNAGGANPGGGNPGAGGAVVLPPTGGGGASPTAAQRQEANGHIDTADVAIEDGDLDKALAEYAAALRLNPEIDNVWGQVGAIYLEKQQWREAESAYREAARLVPYPEYKYNLAMALLRQGRRDDAIASAREGLRLAQESGDDSMMDDPVLQELGITR